MTATDVETEEQRVNAALHPERNLRLFRFGRALAITLLLPAAVYVLTFAAACSRGAGLRSLGLSKFGPILDYGYEARHVDADVLIFGDSSAFLGVDPRIVSSELKLRSAVLPNTIGSLPITGNLVLQRYLEHNRRPRLLVLYFAPWNLNYGGTQRKEFLLEGEEEVLRYGSWKDIAHAVIHYPEQFLVFPFQTLEPLGFKHLRRALHHDGAERGPETARAFGHWDYTLPYDALGNDCALRSEYLNATAHDTVLRIKEKYQSQGMQVAVYLAPIPACSNAAAVVSQSYADVSATPSRLLPPAWFANDSFTAHVRPQYVRQTSEMFADSIRQLLPEQHPAH